MFDYEPDGGHVEYRESMETRHADYPHEPGTLYDCPKCETVCYCTADHTPCVHCALGTEY